MDTPQAAGLAYNDAFFIQGCIFVVLIFFIWIMRRPPIGAPPSGGGR